MKKVVSYANCQSENVIRILARHPILSKEYDFEHATILGNFSIMYAKGELPYDAIAAADLFIYQPTADKHGKYATSEILKHCKPDCIKISFPYIYNYAFWEVLAFADGDYIVGHSGMKYAQLNHKPITRLKEQGLSFEEIRRRIISLNFDWDFGKRFQETQDILRQKEQECDVKVTEFIEANYRDTLLFFTQNHVTLPLLKHVACQMIRILGSDPSLLPNDLPQPTYASSGLKPDYPIGWFSWKHFGFRFMTEPDPKQLGFIIHCAKVIYDGNYVSYQ